MHNLKELKRLSKIWAHNRRFQDDKTLREIEDEIDDFENNQGGVLATPKHKDKLTSLYASRGKILKDREESWRVRSREIQLLEGDDNMKFYHKFTNEQKGTNAIWYLLNENGNPKNTFPQLSSLASYHFKKIYRAPNNATLAEIIRVAQLFPHFVDQEEA